MITQEEYRRRITENHGKALAISRMIADATTLHEIEIIKEAADKIADEYTAIFAEEVDFGDGK